jgi:formin 2
MSLVEISGSDAMAAPMPGRVPPPPPRPPPMPRRLPPMFDAFDHTGAGMVWGFPRPAKKRASLKPLHWVKITSDLQGSLWDELQRRHGDSQTAIELDISELETLFFVEAKPEKIRLHDLRRASYRVFNVRSYYMRANNKVINLSMPLPDMMTAVLAMDESVVDVDQIEKLIKFCPTNEEMELLKTYTGDKAALGKYEQYLLELMKVPRLEAKLRVFSFKTQFGTKITELKERLNVVTSACEEVRSSEKLKEIMKKIPCLGNTSNQGPDRGKSSVVDKNLSFSSGIQVGQIKC